MRASSTRRASSFCSNFSRSLRSIDCESAISRISDTKPSVGYFPVPRTDSSSLTRSSETLAPVTLRTPCAPAVTFLTLAWEPSPNANSALAPSSPVPFVLIKALSQSPSLIARRSATAFWFLLNPSLAALALSMITFVGSAQICGTPSTSSTHVPKWLAEPNFSRFLSKWSAIESIHACGLVRASSSENLCVAPRIAIENPSVGTSPVKLNVPPWFSTVLSIICEIRASSPSNVCCFLTASRRFCASICDGFCPAASIMSGLTSTVLRPLALLSGRINLPTPLSFIQARSCFSLPSHTARVRQSLARPENPRISLSSG